MKKRILSIFLLLTMFFMGIPFVNNEISVKASSEEKLKLLESLGICGELTAPDSMITRAEFVSLVIGTLNENAEGTQPELIFNDVTENHTYSSEISYAKKRGFINGNGNGKFYPDDYITVEEAAIISLRAMGYGKIADEVGYINAARSFALLDDVTSGTTAPLTYGEARQMMYNLLWAPYPDSSYTYDGNEVKVGDETFLYKLWDITAKTGVVESVDYMSLTGEYSVVNNVIISGKVYTPSGISLNGMFGMNVEYYTKHDDGVDYVVYAYPKNNKVVELGGEDVHSFDGSSIVYYDEQEREFTLKINQYTTLFYNMKPVKGSEFISKVTVSGADITLIDNNSDNIYDYVSVMEPIVYSEGYVDKSALVLTDKTLPHINLTDYVMYRLFYSDGKKLSTNEIDDSSRLMVYSSGDKNYPIIVIMADKTTDGEIQSMSTSDETVILTSGEKFKISGKSKVKFAELKAGVNYKFYFDKKGRIVDAEESVMGEYEAVYIMGIKSHTLKGVEMKLLRENGKIENCRMADKVNIRKTDATEGSYTAEEAKYILENTSDPTYGKFVFVKFDSEGNMKEIIQICEDEDKDYHLQKFQHNDYNQKRRWVRAKYSLENQIQLKSSTKVFMAPFAELPIQEDKYYSVTNTDLFVNEGGYYICEKTPRDPDQMNGTPVVIKAGELAADYFLIETPEGQGMEVASTKYGIIYGFYQKYDEVEGTAINVIQMLDHNGSELEVEYHDTLGSYIEIGDVVQINAVKEIKNNNILIYYDRDKDKINYFTFYDKGTGVNEIGWRFYAGFRIVRGKVVKMSGNTALCEVTKDSESTFVKEYIDISKAAYLKLTPGKTKKYETKSAKYLREGEEFFAIMNNGNIRFIVDYGGLQ